MMIFKREFIWRCSHPDVFRFLYQYGKSGEEPKTQSDFFTFGGIFDANTSYFQTRNALIYPFYFYFFCDDFDVHVVIPKLSALFWIPAKVPLIPNRNWDFEFLFTMDFLF